MPVPVSVAAPPLATLEHAPDQLQIVAAEAHEVGPVRGLGGGGVPRRPAAARVRVEVGAGVHAGGRSH